MVHIGYHDDIPAGWDRLVLSCPWGSFYHASANLRIIQAEMPCQLAFWTAVSDQGDLLGGLVTACLNGEVGAVCNSLPFFGSYGDALCCQEAPQEIAPLLYRAMLDDCRARGVLAVTVITSPFAEPSHHGLVGTWLSPTFTDVRRCQITALPEADGCSRSEYLERIFRVFEGRARTSYRRALQESLVIEVNPEASGWDSVLRLHQDNIGGKGGRCKTPSFFASARVMSGKDGDSVKLYTARLGEKVIAGILLFFHGDTVEYHTTGTDEEYRAIGAVNLLITEAMIDAGMRGFRRWNFGGTWASQDGVYKFKRSFGAQEFPYEYHTVFFRSQDSVRAMSAAALLEMYPGFFVLPFSALRNS